MARRPGRGFEPTVQLIGDPIEIALHTRLEPLALTLAHGVPVRERATPLFQPLDMPHIAEAIGSRRMLHPGFQPEDFSE